MKATFKVQYKYTSGKKKVWAMLNSFSQTISSKLLIFASLFLIFLSSCSPQNGQKQNQVQQYTCPMHPEIVEEQPGSCPICGMDLVPMHAHSDSSAVSNGLKPLLQPVNSSILSDIKTVSPLKKQMSVPIQLNGVIKYDSRRENSISLRFAGRIEKLYIHYNFEKIQKGQKLMEIYSPELVTSQNELLYLLQNDPENKALINSSKQKLQLLGLSQSQIEQLIDTKKASYSLAVFSPYSGYVYEKTATVPEFAPPTANMAASGSMGGNSQGVSLIPEQVQLSIQEGMYLSKGQAVFNVINTDKVLAEFTAYPQQIPYLKKGNPVIVHTDDSISINADIDLIQPFYQDDESFSKIRVYLNNIKGHLRPGQLVKAEMQSVGDSSLYLPNAAIIDIGTRKVVFVKDGATFHPQTIQIGRKTEGWTEIVSGLAPSDSIAHDAHFMVDSEGFVDVGY